MRYVTYDENGQLTGAYIQELQPGDASHYIEVLDDAVYWNWLAYQANSARDGLELVPVVVQPPQIPQEVTAEQIALALLAAGYWAAVKTYFVGLPADDVGERARIRFQRRTTVRRDCDLVADVIATLGLTGAQADAVFVAAGAIQ